MSNFMFPYLVDTQSDFLFNYSNPIDSIKSEIIECTVESVLVYNMPIIYNSLTQRLSEIISLNENWDGYNAIVPDIASYSTAIDFIKKLSSKFLSYLQDDDIVPTPYGSIVLDFTKGDNVVSVEIAENKIGFFTDFQNTKNSESDGDILGERIPDSLLYALKSLDLCMN